MRTVILVGVSLLLWCASPWAQQVYEPNEKGVLPPRILTQVKAEYTSAAREARIKGNVVLRATVKADGTVSDVALVRSLDAVHGLDDAAIKALEQWRFRPGTKDGQPVAVSIHVEIAFALR